ncbi:MAG: DUF1738 domain-containing protein [Armatimonadetes bacterium]|nr:DUF1738 domain-containing protein [Armatimonadota bacterium]MDE2205474.1 DUF1738 domain-containing protein [Armatimonadota bacterium]
MEPHEQSTVSQIGDATTSDEETFASIPLRRRKSHHPPGEGAQTDRDVYAIVTERITSALEASTVPWKKPWAVEGGLPRNLGTRRPYRGMNVLLLSLGQAYRSPWWLTFRQATELGGHVRKGEHASLVTFWKSAERRTDHDGTDEGDEANSGSVRRAPILRYYNVFNVEQCEGIVSPPSGEFQPKPNERIEACEMVVQHMPQRPTIRRDPRQASYSPVTDAVGIPDLPQFETAEDYYATLFHELVHSTGHKSRLARQTLGTPTPFGSPDYSQEELVAEFGAAFLCGHTGILPTTVNNQAAYINGWLAVLQKDKRLLPIAASQAQRAADCILASDQTEQTWSAGESSQARLAEEDGQAG